MMVARDIRVGQRLWLMIEDRAVTVSAVESILSGYLRISYLETKHQTEIHREEALAFVSGWRSI